MEKDEQVIIKSNSRRSLILALFALLCLGVFIKRIVDKADEIIYDETRYDIITIAFLVLFIVFLVFMELMSKFQITVTNKRVIGNTPFGRQVVLPLDVISAAMKGSFSSITVATSSGRIMFARIVNSENVFAEINKLLIERQNVRTIPTIAQSSADELEKFKVLFDKGMISQQEFESKKRQLLGL